MERSRGSTEIFSKSLWSLENAFRITVSGSDTKYIFSHFGESEKMFVFEAPIDMLSFITLYKKDWQQHSYIAMNGVYENAVLNTLESHSDLQSVYSAPIMTRAALKPQNDCGIFLRRNGTWRYSVSPRSRKIRMKF